MCRRGGVTRRREAGVREKGWRAAPARPAPEQTCVRACVRARTADSSPSSWKLQAWRLARSPPDNERQKRATSDLRLRVPASVPGIPQDVATRGAVSRGERAGTMPEPRERRRVATVTATRGAVSGEARAR